MQFGQKSAADGATALDTGFPVGRVSGAAHRHTAAGGHHGAYCHLVLRQCAGLVRGDDIGGSQSLDRAKVTHDGVSAGHALDADREDRRHDRRQPFGHRGNREGHAKDQHVEDCRQTADVLDEQNRHDHHDGDRDHHGAQHLADAVELLLERRRIVADIAEHPRDAPRFGLHPRRHDDRPSATVRRRGPAEHHVVPVAEGHLASDRRHVFRDGKTLAGQRRLGGLERSRHDHPSIGRDRVAFLDQDDVAGDDFRGIHAPLLPVADHVRLRCRHLAQRRHGRFRS